jgi:abhydrolase domain-containing protein 14
MTIFEEQYTYLDGRRVRYLFNGVAGKMPLILLHGARFSADTWVQTGTIEVLTRERYSAYAVDLPSFGKSERIPGVSSTAEYAEFLSRLVILLQLRRVALVGPSMSGVISLIFSIKHLDQLSGLVVVGGAGPEVEELKPRLELLDVPTLLVWGEKDVVASVELAREMHGLIKGSELFVIAGAGHTCYLDDPNSFNSVLVKFLGNLKS